MSFGSKRVFALTFFLALAFGAFSASCAALTTLQVPAMDSNENGMITTMTASLVDGSSGVFLDTTPFSGVETQQSAETAAKLAARKSGASLENRAVLYSVKADAEVIEGPSGGVAFALLAYSEFAGKKPRSDLSVTGSVAQDGSVGKVGGVAQKLEAVREAGLKIFLVPLTQSVQQGVDLVELGARYGVSVIEVASFDEAAAIAFSPVGSSVTAPKHEKKPLLLEKIVAPAESEFMRVIASAEITSLRELRAKVARSGESSSQLVSKALDDALNLSQTLFENGYLYSSANAAFVAQVAAESFLDSNYSKQELLDALQRLKAEAEAGQQDYGTLNKGNWAIAAGANARLAWARSKTNELIEKAPLASKPSALVEDLESARAWLRASKGLAAEAKKASAAGAAGRALSELSARGEALELLKQANASVAEAFDSDAEWHLSVARESFERGEYLASSFDSCFAVGFSTAFAEAEAAVVESEEGGEEAALTELFGNSSELASFKNAWAQLYYANSLYNAAEFNRTGDFAYALNVVKLQELSRCLESSGERIEKALLSSESTESAGSVESGLPYSSVFPSPASGGSAEMRVVVSRGDAGLGAAKSVFVFALLVLAALIVFAALLLRAKLRERERPLSSEEREAKLDDLLLKGRVSEATYERLRSKYFKRTQANSRPADSASSKASARRTREPRRRAP